MMPQWLGITLNRFGLIRDKKVMAIGFCSKTNFGHVPMLDYDTQDLITVQGDVIKLQQEFNLSSAFIYKTVKGFHVIYWYDQTSYERVKDIVNASRCDKAYKKMNDRLPYKVLRVNGKYKDQRIPLLKIINSPKSISTDNISIGESLRALHEELNRKQLLPVSQLLT